MKGMVGMKFVRVLQGKLVVVALGQRGHRGRSDGVRCNVNRTGSGPRHRWPDARYCHAGRGEPQEHASGEQSPR